MYHPRRPSERRKRNRRATHADYATRREETATPIGGRPTLRLTHNGSLALAYLWAAVHCERFAERLRRIRVYLKFWFRRTRASVVVDDPGTWQDLDCADSQYGQTLGEMVNEEWVDLRDTPMVEGWVMAQVQALCESGVAHLFMCQLLDNKGKVFQFVIPLEGGRELAANIHAACEAL